MNRLGARMSVHLDALTWPELDRLTATARLS